MESSKKNQITSDTKANFEDSKKEHQSDTNIDSGFLSGFVDSSEITEEPFVTKPSSESHPPLSSDEQKSQQQNFDSGIITECSGELEQNNSKMLLQNPVDPNVTEWFCNLSLSGAAINDLNGNKSKETQKAERAPAPWEIYYQQNEEGDTQLHIAVIHGLDNVVAALLRLTPHPLLLDIQNDYAQTALHISVATNQPNIVRQLIIGGAKASIRDRYGNNPLHLACINGDLNCLQDILVAPKPAEFSSRKAHAMFISSIDLEQWNYDGEKCVHLAAQRNHIDMLKLLVKYGADINAREGKSGRTPLHYAVESNNHKLAKYLMFECPKINLEATTYSGLTAYQLARLMQNHSIVKELISIGANCISPAESETDDSDSDVEDEMYNRPSSVGRFNGNTINVA